MRLQISFSVGEGIQYFLSVTSHPSYDVLTYHSPLMNTPLLSKFHNSDWKLDIITYWTQIKESESLNNTPMHCQYSSWISYIRYESCLTTIRPPLLTHTTQNDSGACCHLMATLKNYNTDKWKTKLLHISNYEHNIPNAINKTSANKGRPYHKKNSPFKCGLHLHLHAQTHTHLRCYTTCTGHTYFRAGPFEVGFEGIPAKASGTT
jgi:hypothetical protein